MPTLAEQMAADSLEAMKLTRKFFVVELDYTPASLALFEDLFAQWHFALPGGRKPENVEKLVRIWGAYLGEVARKAHGGEWIVDGNQGGSIALKTPAQVVHPHDVIRRHLAGEPAPRLAEWPADSAS